MRSILVRRDKIIYSLAVIQNVRGWSRSTVSRCSVGVHACSDVQHKMTMFISLDRPRVSLFNSLLYDTKRHRSRDRSQNMSRQIKSLGVDLELRLHAATLTVVGDVVRKSRTALK